MSIPQDFKNTLEYFNDTILFLRKYKRLYSTPNTHILSNNLFQQFPSEWCSILNNISVDELNKLPFGYFHESWPKSLQEFIIKIVSLTPIQDKEFPKLETDFPITFFKGLNQKKIHEILTLAPFIHENCKKYKTQVIIDIGAGLGYLSQLLNKIYGYKILAIESDLKKVETAIKRQKEIYSYSINDVKYIQHFVDESSSQFLLEQIEKYHKGTNNICLVGLHACADLSITLLKLFSTMSFVNQAIVMPCCYHRLKKVPEQANIAIRDKNIADRFVNFPVSCSLREVYNNEEADKFLTGAFLRLACQNTAANWKKMSLEDHRIHAIGAMRRNVLQLVADTEGYHLSRLKRKTHNSEKDDFLSYLDGLKQTHKLTDPLNPVQEELIISQHFREKMLEVWSSYEKDCPLMEAYTAFQTSFQSICENVLLLDRIEMVKEAGYLCFARKVTDDSVSPRCYALVARKQ